MSESILNRDLDHVLEKTASLWDDLRHRRVLLTGGTGFFGSWLLESYLWAWERFDLRGEIFLLTRDPGRFAALRPRLATHPSVRLIEGDQTGFTMPDGDVSHIIHAAVEYGPPRITLERNFLGTQKVLELAVNRKTERFLFTSSGAVYGPQPLDVDRREETALSTLDPTAVQSSYGEMKRACELLGCTYSEESGFQFCIARCFTFAGPYLDLDRPSAFGNFMRNSLRGEPIQVSGDGTPLRSYLYAADLAAWLWTLLLRGMGGRAYNVGSDNLVPLLQLAQRIAAMTGVAVEVAGKPVEASLPGRYVPNIDRARKELGLIPWIDLDESIRRTRDWHLQSKGLS